MSKYGVFSGPYFPVFGLNRDIFYAVGLISNLHSFVEYLFDSCTQFFIILEMTNGKTKKIRGGSRTAVTSKMECFVIIVNDWKPLTIITKHSILDVAAVLDPPLKISKIQII